MGQDPNSGLGLAKGPSVTPRGKRIRLELFFEHFGGYFRQVPSE
jgi:hypothetical protein